MKNIDAIPHNGESQNSEYKKCWSDEYLKWICGFANAQGGSIYIGIDDEGHVCGVPDAARLMEDIPNKVRDTMGLIVDVNLHTSRKGLQYVEVHTDPYPYPVSIRGEYFYRTGSTKQQLKGAALDRFMLRKQGRTWDGVPLPRVQVEDLDPAAFKIFRNYARQSGRVDERDLKDTNEALLDKLRLFDDGMLKRAAVLLFHPDPERFVSGAFIKIGRFREHAQLLYQDEVHGSLIQQSAMVIDLLLTKYLAASISYEGIIRVERYPVPREALREALLNAIVHKDYAQPHPIQLAVYDNRIEVWNPAVLPEGWTVQTLLGRHRSRPYNPDIANAFFRAGEIETWGRGIERIVDACRSAGVPAPSFEYDGGMWSTFPLREPMSEHGGGINVVRNVVSNVVRNNDVSYEKSIKKEYDMDNSGRINGGINGGINGVSDVVSDVVSNPLVKISDRQHRLYKLIKEGRYASAQDMADVFSVTHRTIQRDLATLRKKGLIAHVGNTSAGHWVVLKDLED